ncbi:MAG: prepilin-type N-terminal cleavage/methylation domain-containing protein [Proteobacteria bacterium]|nr:prepilin-type N-terminal cleavage/methylation domain-containing protein [Pseudomonadota bacterium]MBU4012017.1 prepilin-type N-terminal cleavage/methylation domain-containing protein [Pseudomonadota bacterium]MBU4069318.1 prepilin-type N-terminal cleavage/methylation domain-containing protein [Pseudomonadota bacterium]MBU4127697.1 prepilin-type N-terminal cleavage/methylation domain-containing protein [Pseudomonadota bacterium]
MNYFWGNNENGFTLIEMLISMAIGMIIIIALSSTFLLQRDAYDDQEQIAEMVQTARAAMDMMTREIRMAGYDPAGTMQRSDPTGAKFVGIPYDANKLQIYADLNGDEDTDDSHEYIKYTMDSDYPFEIRRDTGGGRQEFALNIQTFTFSYLDSSGNATTTTSDIRQIEITITARTAEPDGNYTLNSGYRTYTLTSYITPRNLAL